MFFDADRDGWVDLYVGNYVDWSPENDVYCGFQGEKVYCTPEVYDGISARFYHNNGDGTFSERTEQAGFVAGIEPERDKTLGVAELDFNRDGWPDVIVANDTDRDLLYVNNGDGTFVERGVMSGVAFNQHGKPRAGMGIDAGVVDSSGRATVFVGNFSEEMVGVYQYVGNGLFTERGAASKIGGASVRTLTFGLFLFDADLDTDLDLLTANGHVQTHIEKMMEGITFRERTQVYLNRGDGIFMEVLPETGVLTQQMVARGAAYADYDRDGDLDVLLVENDGPVHLWRNEVNTASALRVRLDGRESNRNALGSRVVASVGGLHMERRIRTGSSFLSQSETVATFGLGRNAGVDSLRVYWLSGQESFFSDIQGGREIVIVEGEDLYQEEVLVVSPQREQ